MNDGSFTPKQVCQLLNITYKTLLPWNHTGKIRSFKTPTGRFRYPKQSILAMLHQETESIDRKKRYCYCRVSTASQKEDLERQITFFRDQFPHHIIIPDIGSGLNFKRKGFQTLLEQAIQGNIREIVVTHKDRLCRFGFELFERVLKTCSDGNILVLDKREISPQQELVDDLLSIITVFSSRLYGLRSHSIKKKIKEGEGRGQTKTKEKDFSVQDHKR